MNKTAGIKPLIRLDDILLGELKQAILLFDLIGIPSLDQAIKNFNETHKPDCNHRYIINELEYLKEQGHLFNSLKGGGTTLKKDADLDFIAKEFKQLSDIIKGGNSMEISMEAAARLSCLTLNNSAENHGFYSLPLIKQLAIPQEKEATRTDIINLVIEQMPIPDEKTPWENIFEFKSNSDNIGRFSGIRNWVNKSVRSGVTPAEVKDELEYLIYQYKKSLDIHKIKHETGILETLVVGTAELLENTLRLKFSDIAKGFFSAKHSKADLLAAELTSPGNELAYIYKAQEVFNK